MTSRAPANDFLMPVNSLSRGRKTLWLLAKGLSPGDPGL
jgi:hypothetical protein